MYAHVSSTLFFGFWSLLQNSIRAEIRFFGRILKISQIAYSQEYIDFRNFQTSAKNSKFHHPKRVLQKAL
jgi:hypothetical protein